MLQQLPCVAVVVKVQDVNVIISLFLTKYDCELLPSRTVYHDGVDILVLNYHLLLGSCDKESTCAINVFILRATNSSPDSASTSLQLLRHDGLFDVVIFNIEARGYD